MQTTSPRRTLSVADAIMVVLGVVIGAGIFAAPSMVAGNVPNGTVFILVWVAGGLISLMGALCYAELATTYPDAGGEYHFLHRGLGSGPAFLFAWARLAVIQTGSIAIHAFIIGDYVADLVGRDGALVPAAIAVLTVVLLTALNITGLRQGKWTQRILTTCVVAAVLLVCAGGLSIVAPPQTAESPAAPNANWALGMAMVFVLLTYGGWNEAAYLSAEVRGERRGIVKVLLGGITLVTVVYVLANVAYLRGLGLSGIAGSDAVAADLMRRTFAGETGAKLIALAIVVAAVGNMNATILTGARASYAFGRDFSMFGALGRWNAWANAPVVALIVQGVMTLALVIFGAVQRQGFQSMVEYTTPVFWLFFLLTGLSLFKLRHKDPAADRPFRVPLYPLTPLLFCAACAYMLYSGLAYVRVGALVGVGVLLLGIPLMLLARRRERPGPEQPQQLERSFDSLASGDPPAVAVVADHR